MIGTVVTPLDGSELAENALVYASGIAQRTGAPILLTRVVSNDAGEAETAECRDYLRRVGEGLTGQVRSAVLKGRPAEVIVASARDLADSIIVMSTHGHGGLRRWFTGSVADEVVRTSGRPVLLVRAGVELPDRLALHSILVPLDGSKFSEVVIDYATELARAFDSQVHLVRVVDTPSAYAMLSRQMETAVTGDVLDEIIQSMTSEARTYLREVEERLTEQGIKVKSVVLDGYPGEQLLDYERSGYFQLVLMATAGRSGVGRIVFGSVAERMLKMGRSPVMMIRPRDDGHTEPEDDSI